MGNKFEVVNGYEGFTVDERLGSCSCRSWQLSGIPCQHGCAAIYFLRKNPEDYISEWYSKARFVTAYTPYLLGMNGMDQWPSTNYQKPLPPIVKKMPGRPPHKRKKDAGEKDDGNRTRVGRKGVIMHCSLCKGEGHNVRGCPTRKEGESVGESSCGKANRGGKNESARGSVRGGKTMSVSGQSVRGGKNGSTSGPSVRGVSRTNCTCSCTRHQDKETICTFHEEGV